MPLDQVDVDKLDDQKEMSFLDHLEELRWHIIRSLAAILIVAIGIFLAKSYVFEYLLLGPTKPDFPTYYFLCDVIEVVCINPADLTIITRDLGEQFITHIVSSFWLGLIVAFPYILWEFWRFIKPGLYTQEQKASRGIVLICSLLFIAGILFGYFVITPFAVSFLSSYSVDPEVANTVTLSSYINYLVMFCLPAGIIFELPIIMYFLAKIGLVDAAFLKTYRRHAIVIVFILASMVTPPDVVTQFLIGIPLVILYEISIIITKRVDKNSKY